MPLPFHAESRRAAFFAARRALLAIVLALAGCSSIRETASRPSPRFVSQPVTLEDLSIDVSRDSSREIAYTNKEAGVYYTETNGPPRSAWQGWRVMSTEVLKGYSLTIDSVPLLPSSAGAAALPHQLVRNYPLRVSEKITLLDSINALVVELDNVYARRIAVRPLFSGGEEDFVTKFRDGVLLIARKNHLTRTEGEDFPVWLGVANTMPSTWQLPRASREASGFAPSGIRSVGERQGTRIAFVLGDSEEQTISLAKEVASRAPLLIAKRKLRMERLLNHSYVSTGNRRFDKALHWAKLSLDALVMRQGKRGLFAGLPWFDNYWGRDSFIALLGATLASGSYGEAREILRSFAEWQDTNSTHTTYGRIPNLVTTTSIAYNTADGTPRFVIALDEYAKWSGDSAFMRELWPVVRRSIDGTLRYHTDSLGFLFHTDAETWMDAVGPEGPWSPRGDRANDVQELWFRQLQIGRRCAAESGDPQRAAHYAAAAELLKFQFSRHFTDSASGLIADHLRPDGTRDRQLRPNQLFVDELASERLKRSVFKRVTEELVYPHGVASLSRNDEEFHPYHHFAPAYVQDAAYHNGIVWTWLAGPWIDRATGYGLPDLAFPVTENMVHQMLDRGAVGTISELLDAAPRPGEQEPRLSGTFSQAWSLAEFVRTFYQAYCGARVDATLRRVELAPALPRELSRAEFDLAIGDESIRVAYAQTPDSLSVRLFGSLRAPITVALRWSLSPGFGRTADIRLMPEVPLSVMLTRDGSRILASSGVRTLAELPSTSFSTGADLLGELRLAPVDVPPHLKALRGPSHRMLSHAEIMVENPDAQLHLDASDPKGDDTLYAYPRTRSLRPGSLDITRFTVRADKRNAYFSLAFRELSDPGWHPEYGFQLTYAAIAIDKDGKGAREVGMNSLYRFDSTFAYRVVVFVGGGLRLLNDSAAVLAEYLPVPGDEREPLGRVGERRISFSLPVDLIGMPRPAWRYALLVGCQDDHGGAGIGEFRSVEAEATEWVGGGKQSLGDPNVYDKILPPERRRH